MRPAGTREYKNYAECKDVSLYSAEVESFRAERGSGSDKRIVSDSLYDDVQHLGFRGVRGDRFLTYPNRAGSLETCGFKQRFWSLLGLRPKATRARGRGTLPAGGSDPSAASGGCRGVSEWQRSKFQASAVRKHRNFGHRNSVPFRNKAGRRGRRPLRVCGRTVQ